MAGRSRCSRRPSAADEALAARIRTVHDDDSTYGAPRITAELNDGAPDDERVNHKRVARVMRAAGIAGYRRRRRVKTTTADQANQKVPDLLAGTSPHRHPTPGMSATSRTCRWPPARICIWRR